MSTSLICPTRSEQYCLNFSMKDLVKESLRMRPDRIVLGEARSDEAKDFIQALSTGHKGCLSSIHASSTKDALTRLECLIAQGAPNWSTPVIRQLIATGVQWIIHVEKTKDGLREVKTISEITSLEHNGFLLQDLYSSSDF
jgi:pilus assembly protein CpaF